MPKIKTDYQKQYRAQRKHYYRNRIKDFREELNETEYATALAELKLQNMDDLDLIKEAEGEVE